MSPEARINQINFDLLFKNNPLPMWIYDIQSLAFLEVNDAAVKKYGYSRKKFLSMTLKNIRPKEDVERLIKDVSKKRPALQQSRNWRHKFKSGKIIDVEITSHTIKYNGRKAALVTARDITDQKLAGEKINKLNKVYSVLSEVNQTIVRTRNANELFKSICRIAVNNGGYAMAWIGMLDREDNKVKVIASAGVSIDYLKKINIDLNDKKRGGGPTGLAVKTGKHVISNNIESDKRMLPGKNDAVKYGYKSSASFPIKVFGKVVGSFTLYSSQELFFNDEEINLLDEMVMDLSFALEFIEEEKVKREAEEKLKITQFGIDHSQIGVYQIDEEGNINYANEQACKSLGYTYKELTSRSILDIDPTFSLKKWKEHRKNIRKKGSGTIESIHKRKDGTEFFVEVSINYFDYDGRKLSFSFAKDISKRKLAEEALSKSEENLSITLHSIGDAVISTDNKGSINKMNPTAEKLCGWKINDAIGKPLNKIFKIINADTRIAIDSPFEKVIKTGKVVGLANHTILISRNGTERNIVDSAAPIKDSKGNIKGVVLVFSDVTEAYKTRKELQDNEVKWRSLVSNSPDYIALHDIEGKYLFLNHYAKGFTKAKVIGSSLFDYLSKESIKIYKKKFDECITTRTIQKFEYRTYGDDKKFRIYEQFLVPILNENKDLNLLAIARDITERKGAEQALNEMEIELAAILESTADGILAVDQNGKVIKTNKQFAELWQIPKTLINSGDDETLLTFVLDQLLNPEQFLNKVHQLYNTTDEDLDILIFKDGRVFERFSTPLLMGDKISGRVWSFRDITKRKQTEEALRKSRKEFKSYFDSGSIGLSVTAPDKTWIEINQRLCEMLGYSKEELSGLTWDSITYPEDLAENLKLFQQALEGKIDNYETDKRFIRKDGSIIYITLSVVCQRNNDGTVNHFLSSYNDITKRKLAEEELSNERTLLKNIIDSIPNPIYVKDLQGRRIIANQAAALSAGKKSVDEILGKTNFEIFPFDYAEKSRIEEEEIIKTGKTLENIERNFTSTDGKEHWYIGSKVLLKDSKGNPFGILAVNLDITDRKLMEEQLQEKENQMRTIIEGTPQLFFYSQNVNSKVTYISPSVKKITGRSVDEWLNQSHWFVTNNEINEYAKQKTHSHLRGELTEGPILVEVEHADKHPILLEVYESPIIKNKKVVGLQGVAHDISERKRAEQTLRESEERFRNLIENINEVFYISDGQGRIEYCSPNSFTSIGYPAQDILGKSYIRLVAPIDRRLVIDYYFEQTAKGVSDTQLIFRVRCKDGKIIWVEQITNIVRDTSGKVVGFRNVARDITLRKLAEEELRKSKEELQKFFEDDLSANYISTLSGQLLNCNKTFLNIFGFKSREEALKFPIEKLYSDSVPRTVFIDLLKKNKKVESFECEYVSLDGKLIYTIENAVAESDSKGKFIQIRGYIVDITKRKIAEEELKKQSRAVEQSPASVVITNQDGDIEYVNKKFSETTGYSKKEVMGKNPRILKSGQQDKKFYEELWNNILQGKEWKGEMRNKKKNGDLFWESVLISPLVNNEGDITHFVAVKEDITEKKMMVVELINAKEKAESANKLKDAFIANISHEIRSPLNGILGLTSIIKDIYAEHIKEGDEELFVGIDHSSNRLIRTVDMILNYSRIQTGEFPVTPKKLELSSICENLVKEFNTAAKGRKLELSFKNKIDKKVMIFGDEYSITHSISNLIDNAIKYTNKGFVNIILYNGDDDEVLLDLKDSGIGISEGYIQHIFEPYQQEQMGYGRAYEGVGLGLPIVKKFLGLNKAGISVESKKGEGTTFTINFGKSIKSTVEKLTEEKIIKNVLSQERENKPLVLLVEDDAINQSTVKRFIDANYNTVVTDNSESALEILKTNKIDLILMDISIKGNKNGLELTKELKSSKEYSNIPVIAITAHAFDMDRQNSLEAGCDDYLSKPFSKKLLLETIGKFI